MQHPGNDRIGLVGQIQIDEVLIEDIVGYRIINQNGIGIDDEDLAGGPAGLLIIGEFAGEADPGTLPELDVLCFEKQTFLIIEWTLHYIEDMTHLF